MDIGPIESTFPGGVGCTGYVVGCAGYVNVKELMLRWE